VLEEEIMTLELSLSSETEARLRERAAEAGQDVAGFVLDAVNEKLAEVQSHPSRLAKSDKHWREKLQALIDLHPIVDHFVDDSRESIYAGRGE
jgi:uncharacterized protein (DUF1778 family)